MDLESMTQSDYEDQQFKGAKHKKTHIQSKNFHECTFKNCQFNETVFQDCVFIACVFEGCDLSLVRLPGTTFSETIFHNSKLVGVNWAEANWDHHGLLKRRFVDFHACTLDYSTFIGLKLEKLTLHECSAKQVIFEDADLTGADCTGTDFAASRFVRTNLTEADFVDAVNYAISAGLNTLHKTKFTLPEAISLLHSLDIILVE